MGLLPREEAETLMRLSEGDGSMVWESAAVDAAWALTSGHPFLLQQLCWELWERLHDEDEGAKAWATAKDVGSVVARTLDTAANVFEWIWNGVAAGRAGGGLGARRGGGACDLAGRNRATSLHESGVRVVIRELRDAPQLLQDWDLIEPANGGYLDSASSCSA